MAIFILVLVIHLRRTSGDSDEDADEEPAPIPPAPILDLHAIQRLDPEFSLPMFEDFAYRLYANAYRSAHDENLFGALAPYLQTDVQAELREFIPQRERVTAVVVGAIKVTSIEVAATHTDLEVEYSSNLSLRSAHAGESARYARESWTFRRRNQVRSKPAAEVERLGCPSCGAAFEANTHGQCAHCHEAVGDGRFGWQVVSRDVAEMETVPPSLTEDVSEGGTHLPTKVDARCESELKALFNADPQLDQSSLRGRLQLIFEALNKSWNTRDLSAVRPYVTDSMYDYLRYWIEAYSAQGLKNQLTEAEITRIERVKLLRDKQVDAVTFRFWATGYDATLTLASNTVVCGSREDKRHYSEYWTLLRSAMARGKPRTDLGCPSCAAPLAVEQTGCCAFCGTRVTRGEFDWVLSKIEQDDVYA